MQFPIHLKKKIKISNLKGEKKKNKRGAKYEEFEKDLPLGWQNHSSFQKSKSPFIKPVGSRTEKASNEKSAPHF